MSSRNIDRKHDAEDPIQDMAGKPHFADIVLHQMTEAITSFTIKAGSSGLDSCIYSGSIDLYYLSFLNS
jgi:hypothetical protein